ncbi:MAG: Transglutaminase-like superfamily protein [Candidatus Cloacimonetes bacterium ADurb.Bin089]|nr:MAG: Transglutaminase-like superfamily protein [Candidatus Cloacimonetes bacterium ADurb.Bin089]
MKKTFVLLALLLTLTSLFALPAELSRTGNPELYKELSQKAKKNLELLPREQKQQYKELLNQYPDILMNYLLAYESNSNLAASNPEDVKSNYLAICALLNNKGLKYPVDFFLSYIAKQTVSDEPLTAYREQLLKDGLQNIINITNSDLDMFRSITLWCVSRIQFQQTSGRDQSPLDIVQKSLIGRCEEMQILLVSACRTIGLPARPAYTPWWPHTDNNHAWTEIYLDGNWHYTGDMDMAWFPDNTWFSDLVDKTALILADGTLTSWKDEVLLKSKYETLINSTANYTKERSRKVKIKVTDANNKPIPNANVIPMVFNWGSLRSLTNLTTDKNGYLEFTTGRGSFYLSVYAKTGKALVLIPSNEEKTIEMTIRISNSSFPGGWNTLEYPEVPGENKTQPAEYINAVNLEKQRWQEKQTAFENAALNAKTTNDTLAINVALACRGNYASFWEFYRRNPNPDSKFLTFLLEGDPKLLWQANAELLEALYENWLRLYKPETEEEKVMSLFSPVAFYEDLPKPILYQNGKAQLYPESFRYGYSHSREGVIKVLSKLKQKYKIKPQKALSGLPPLHILIQQKNLTATQYKIMAVYLLRANAYPTEFVRIPNLVSVFIDGDWQYVNVEKCAWEDISRDNQSKTFEFTLQIKDTQGNPIEVGEEQLTLCHYAEGMFYPLNENFKYLGSGKYNGVFPVSDVWLQFGYRVSENQTKVYLQPLKPKAGDSLSCELIAEDYPVEKKE